jgi:hypothetical protein
MTDLLAIYLNDHLMGATAGLELFRRVAGNIPAVRPIAVEVAEDREALLRFIEAVGAQPDQVKVAAGWVGEKLGRLKLNGSLLNRSPLSDVIELEALTLGVQGKLAGWRLLRALHDPRLAAAELDRLIVRAEKQAEALENMRLASGTAVLAPRPSPATS